MSSFAITISKYNRGSMSKQEIDDTVNFFTNKFIASRLLIVNEHTNFKHEPFEHLHISISILGEKRTDNLNALIKKNLSFIQNRKDLIVKKEISDGWKEYCCKSDDMSIVHKLGITDEEIDQYKLDYKIKVATVKDSKNNISKVRIPKNDIAYVMQNYIQDNEMDYDFRLVMFQYIIHKMLLDGYDFELRNLPEVKSKLDNALGNSDCLNTFINDQFKFLYQI